MLFECVEPFVEPAREHFALAAAQIRNVNLDGRGLTDPVEAADALFEQFGIIRQIEKDEVMRELKVAPFAPDL